MKAMGIPEKPNLGRDGKPPKPLPAGWRKRRWLISAATLAVGIVVFVFGVYLFTRSPQSNKEGDVALLVLAIPIALMGAGISLPFARPRRVAVIALASPFVVYPIAVLLLWGWVVMVAAPRAASYFAALKAAEPNAPYVSDFARLFPDTEVRYRYFAPGDQPGYDLHVLLYERYELTMQLSVRYNASGNRVVGYGEPHLYLLEVSGVQGRTISYNSTNERKFGAREWQAIVGSGGDFSAIGYPMIQNQPVAKLKKVLMRK